GAGSSRRRRDGRRQRDDLRALAPAAAHLTDRRVATAVYLEVGNTKTFACAVEWPGWCRSGKGEEAALEAMAAYAERYRPVVEAAGVRWPKTATRFEIVERSRGSGATDFGVLDKPCSRDERPLRAADARRYAARRVAWHVLDHVWEIEDKSE